MPALVETLFYRKQAERDVPWHGLGTPVPYAPTSREALELAGLDWKVNPQSVYLADGTKVPNTVANVRDKDNKVLGTVSDKYKIVQNTEAFDFVDSLVGDSSEVHYETAGSLKEGRTVWLLAQMPRKSILGDDVDPYLCFTNTHDGSGAIRVCLTPTRVVCQNTLSLALNKAKRTWTCRHMGNMSDKLAEAKFTLGLANEYFDKLALEADRLADIRVSDEQVLAWVNDLFPILPDDSDCKKRNAEFMRSEFLNCYIAPDIVKFMGTGWGIVNAASDFATHTQPNRDAPTFKENNFIRVLNGHPVIDYFHDKVNALAVK